MISRMWALVLAHLIGDFLIQREHDALNKHKSLASLLVHCTTYTAVFAPVLYLYSMSLWWLAFIFATHVAIDNGWLVRWWSVHVAGQQEPDFWLLVVRDQVLHLLVLAVVAW